MYGLNTPDVRIDGARISTSAERTARAIGTTILILGILIALTYIIIGIIEYLDYKKKFDFYSQGRYGYDYGYDASVASKASSKALKEILIPCIIQALFYFIITFLTSMALKVLANISLTIKAKAFSRVR